MLTALLALCLSSSPTAKAGEESTPSLEEFFRQPERVQIFLADMDDTWDMPKAGPDTRPRSGFFILSREGPALKLEDRQALAKAWVSPRDYKPRPPHKCMFNPDIALRFWRGKTWVDAVVCFSCEDIFFHDAKGKSFRGGFLEGFALMRRLAANAFPEGGFFKN